MNDITWENLFGRQIKLRNIGVSGQKQISESSVLIIGVGGLGSAVVLYLAGAGVGKLTLVDYDIVEVSNLHRQIVHGQRDIGNLKVDSGAETLINTNPLVDIETLSHELDQEELVELTKEIDVIVDCSDNFPTRFLLNKVSLQNSVPMVSGAAIRWEGQVTSFDPRSEISPCYECLYPNTNLEGVTCTGEGVISPLVGVIGTMQALEPINILLSKGVLHGTLWMFDGNKMDWQNLKVPKKSDCNACSHYNTQPKSC